MALAARAHEGQVDKAGQPSLLHPLRMMLSLTDPAARIVAVLHDVVEDCGVTLDDLRAAGFDETVVRAVEAVTARDGESYEQFVERAGRDPIARQVKLADLRDNSDPRRIAEPTERDLARLAKYQRAIAVLEALD